MKTRQQINSLKADWEYNPFWDIEDTEGFETHYIELKAHRLRKELEWKQNYTNEIEKVASDYECSAKTAELLSSIKTALIEIEQRLTELDGRITYMGFGG